MSRAAASLARALLLGLALGGCGRADDRAEGPDAGAGTEAPSDTSTSGAPLDTFGAADSGAVAGNPLPPGRDTAWTIGIVSSPSTVERGVAVLSALRAGKHPGYERITLELSGEGTGFPAYTASYIDKPLHECGSGDQIFPVGDAWLEVRMEPLDAHTQEGQPTIPHRPRELPGLSNVKQVYVTCDFEAVTTLVFAVGYPGRFRAFTLDAPRRVVVDIAAGR